MGEGVGADDGLVGLDLDAREVGHRAAQAGEFRPTRPSLAPTMALLAWTWMPVKLATERLRRVSSSVWHEVYTGKLLGRVAMDMITSSREALPARSPMPLMVSSTWRA